MSRTNENKLKMKDIATIGIFSALLFVVTMVAGALMGISMVLNMYSVAVVAVLSAPLYMLIMAKVHKKGAVLLTFAIVGILWGLFGGIFVLIWMLGFGIVGEVLASKSKYQNYKMLTVSFGLYSVGYYLGAIAPLYYYPAFWYGFDRPKETRGCNDCSSTFYDWACCNSGYTDRNCDRCCNCKENVEEAF